MSKYAGFYELNFKFQKLQGSLLYDLKVMARFNGKHQKCWNNLGVALKYLLQ